nr:hypothetical protein OG999_49555 [Streptomyces sp. NBC_00886]
MSSTNRRSFLARSAALAAVPTVVALADGSVAGQASAATLPDYARGLAQEARRRDLRRCALQPFLDDMLVEAGHGVDPRVLMQVHCLVLTQHDVLAVGLRRAEQTDARKIICHVRDTYGVHAEVGHGPGHPVIRFLRRGSGTP